jgi:hypothetical protein
LFSPDVAIINTQEKAALGAAFSCDSFITAVDCAENPRREWRRFAPLFSSWVLLLS